MSLADHITEIRTLAAQGKNEADIAAAVGLEIGDVATVLTLGPMAAAELPPSGASGGSEQIPVPTDAASWDVADAVGTWDFSTPGEIAQTDPTVGGAGAIFTLADHFAAAWVLQAEIRVDEVDAGDLNTASGFFVAGVTEGGTLGGVLAACGVNAVVPVGAACIVGYGVQGSNGPSVAVGDWHTYRVAVLHATAFGSLDGVQFGWSFPGFSGSGAVSSPLGLTNVDGAVTFRNLKAWRIPVPDFT